MRSLTDPVGSGYVESLARPGRNVTGFMLNDYSLNAKYPELLKEIAPEITQVAILRDASQGAGTGDFAVIQAMAPLLRVQVNAIDLHETGEIEIAVAAFARSPNGGLIMPGSAAGRHYRDLIISLAARHKLPAVYPEHFFAAAGGLITYGPNWIDQYRLAAGYVDRILKGEKPADLPVQAPTKYELSINLKTAKALGLSVPATLLAARGRGDRIRCSYCCIRSRRLMALDGRAPFQRFPNEDAGQDRRARVTSSQSLINQATMPTSLRADEVIG